jgi:hypothetical protein
MTSPRATPAPTPRCGRPSAHQAKQRPLPKEGPNPKSLAAVECRRRDSNPRLADYDSELVTFLAFA